MPRPRRTLPTVHKNPRGYLYSRDATGGQIWFGHESKPESHANFAKWLDDIQRGVVTAEVAKPQDQRRRWSVNELALKFLNDYCQRYNRSAETHCFRSVIKPLSEVFGLTAVDEFGPLRLRAVRDAMIAAGWKRKFINKQIGRLRLVFRHGVSVEMVPPSVLAALEAVPPLAPRESSAPESTPRRAVPEADIAAVRAVLKPLHRDVLDLLLLTGARPAEILGLTTGMIDRSGDVWRANLVKHKTSSKGKSRTLYFNRSSQQLLLRYIKADPTLPLFKLARAYFGSCVKAACIEAGVTPFVPHQMRHTTATRIVDELGVENAQQLLGHSGAAMTRHYSRGSEQKAIEAVSRLGQPHNQYDLNKCDCCHFGDSRLFCLYRLGGHWRQAAVRPKRRFRRKRCL